ncbi:MAG: family 10 glycosylhydrolase [Gemmatimonadetes bacterium]|nr:family 10 glycosylhydrolase [Gemmatimonadota bacterium]
MTIRTHDPFFIAVAGAALVASACATAERRPADLTPSYGAPALEREFRGVWVASVANIDWPSRPGLAPDSQRAELLAILDRAAALRLNAVILQVRPGGDALYASSHEPWSEYLTGTMGAAPEPFYDPLRFAIDAAHARGLELHAWFNPYRARHPSATSAISPEHLARRRPELVVEYGAHLWMDPGEPEVLAHSVGVILDVVRRYDVDGVHIDDYFYPYRERDAAGELIPFPDDASWGRYRAEGGTLDRGDWRRDNVDRFVERLYHEVKAEKPWVRVGVSPIGIWRPGHPPGICCFDAYEEIYADARKWLVEGWLDYFVPQLYRPIADTLMPYPLLLGWWAEQNARERHLWPGLIPNRVRASQAEDGWPGDEIVRQVLVARGHPGASGHVHFSARALMRSPDGLNDALSSVAYRTPALAPSAPWLDDGPPAQPRATLVRGAGADEAILGLRAGDREPPRWWVVRTRRSGRWTVDVVPGARASVRLAGETPLEAVAVSAVDRLGNESALQRLAVPAAAVAAASVPPGPEEWVERTLASLSLREKVGQLVVPWLGGDYLPLDSESHDRLRKWVVEDGIGGVVISIGPPLEMAAKLNAIQAMAAVPLLVAADMEHGPGQRLTAGTVMPYGLELGGGTEFPPVMALGAAGDERLAYEMGRITALEARAVGIHMVYGPVVDVNNNPANPIINVRSYGEDPAAVARLTAAHIRGMQEHGVIATAKHFPGHGDTGTDSHIALPVIGHDRARADSIELVPFRAAIDAGVGAVMSAHIAFPALTGDSVPATLHPRILTTLLRDELGFEGLVTTDALDMGGIVEGFGPAATAVRALEAGADILLMPVDIDAAIDAVVSAVERGELPEARIDRSVRKILRAKADAGLHRDRTVELDRVPGVVGTRSHRAVARDAAERSITVARDRDRLLPMRPADSLRVLTIVYADDPDPLAGRAFRRALEARFPAAESALLDAAARPEEMQELLEAAERADVVVFAPFVRVLAWKGDVAIAEPVTRLVRDLAARRPTVVVSFGNPYVLGEFPDVGTYVLAWGQENVAQEAAARALTGEIPVTGRLPIAIPPDLPVGGGVRVEPIGGQ